MGQETFKLTLNGVMNVSDIQSNIQKIQKMLSGIKLPSSLSANFSNVFSDLTKQLEKAEDQISKGFTNKSDLKNIEKIFNNVNSLINQLTKDFNKIDSSALEKIVDQNTLNDVKELKQQITDIKKEISQIGGINELSSDLQQLSKLSKSKAIGNFSAALKVGDLEAARKELQTLQRYVSEPGSKNAYFGDSEKQKQFNDLVNKLVQDFQTLQHTSGGTLNDLNQELQEAATNIQQIKGNAFEEIEQNAKDAKQQVEQFGQEVRDLGDNFKKTGQDQINFNNELDNIKQSITYFFGLENAINLFRNAIRNAFETVKELDAAMTETAVVTDFTVGDMWEALPQYTKTANELGATTLGAYETMTLFYQQGLDTNQAFEVGTETMKMARIAAMDYTEATDLI